MKDWSEDVFEVSILSNSHGSTSESSYLICKLQTKVKGDQNNSQ